LTLTKKTLKNNVNLINSVNEVKGLFPNTRALVLDRSLSGLESIQVKDFYNIVITEGESGLESVPVPDFIILEDSTPYRNSRLYLETLYSNENTIYLLNYNLVEIYKKLKRKIDLYSINYLPAVSQNISASPIEVHLTSSGLNSNSPGVHFAKILGCTAIHYTGISDESTTVDITDIREFTEAKGITQKYVPENFISKNRETVLNTSF